MRSLTFGGIKREITPKERKEAHRANMRVYGVYLKLNEETDGDIIDKLESVDKKQSYIKDLIRKDLFFEKLDREGIR